MYEAFFGLNRRPFSLTPDPDFLYLSKQHAVTLAMLEYGLGSQAGFTLITGEIGSGKTTLIRHILKHIGGDVTVGVITNTHRNFGNLLTWILSAFGLERKHTDKVEMYQQLIDFVATEFLQGRRVVLIVDEAQNMDVETLEELRLLSNMNIGDELLLQLVIVGQPELQQTLMRPELAQFAQRISVEHHKRHWIFPRPAVTSTTASGLPAAMKACLISMRRQWCTTSAGVSPGPSTTSVTWPLCTGLQKKQSPSPARSSWK
jgi:type II secretory pathway predicted ATPase ExeA